MILREIKQHHIPAVLSIGMLFIVDTFSFYFSYVVINKYTLSSPKIEYSLSIYVIIIFIIYIFKNYNPSPRISRGSESKKIIQSIYVLGIFYIVVRISLQDISIDQASYSLIFLHTFLIIDILLRFFVRSMQRIILRKGIGGRNTIILGSGEEAQHLVSNIKNRPELGFQVLGYFAESEFAAMNRYFPYLGAPDKIESYVLVNNVHEMIIVLEQHEHDKLLDIIGLYEKLNICIKIIPDMYESITGQVRIDMLNSIFLMDINPDIMTELQQVLKRLIDIVFSLLALIFFSPVILLLIVLIPINSSGSPLYSQIRLGKNQKSFNLYKFRSMYQNSETNTGPIWASPGDERITYIGKTIRKYHLDEIPQFVNVFKGEMSIVGPRPERPKIIEKLTEEMPYYSHRMKIKPGITGWAQIKGAYDTNLKDVYKKLQYDFYYIENISISMDIKIILLTIWTLFKGKGL